MSYFADETIVKIVSGKGGEGCISFRPGKYMPFSGPDGGDRVILGSCGWG